MITLATFAGNPKGLAVDHHNNVYVAMLFTGEIRKIAPNGDQSTVAFLPPGAGHLLGLAIDYSERRLYASRASFDENHGIWSVDLSRNSIAMVASFPLNSMPNGIALLNGDLYVADSRGGRIWRLGAGQQLSVWRTGPELAPLSANGMGASALAAQETTNSADRPACLYVTNTQRNSVLCIPIERDHSPGSLSTLASGAGLGTPKGIAAWGDSVYVAVNAPSGVIEIDSGGQVSALSDSRDLDSLSGLAVSDGALYATGIARFARPVLVRIDVVHST